MLDYMERTGKTGSHAILATYRAFQNHLNYYFFRVQMIKAGIKVPTELATLELACAPKNKTVADLVAEYIGKRSSFERCDLKGYVTMKREYVNDHHLTRVINNFKQAGKIERVGKGAYLSKVAA